MQVNNNFGFSNPSGTANNSMGIIVGNGGTNSPLPFNFFGSLKSADRVITITGAGTLGFSGTNTITIHRRFRASTLTVNNGTTTTSFGTLSIANNYNLTSRNSTAARNDVVNGTGSVVLSGVDCRRHVNAGSGLTYSGTGYLTLSTTTTPSAAARHSPPAG